MNSERPRPPRTLTHLLAIHMAAIVIGCIVGALIGYPDRTALGVVLGGNIAETLALLVLWLSPRDKGKRPPST